MTWVLRHGATEVGLAMDDAGFVALEDLLQIPQLKSSRVTVDMAKDIVATCPKQRFKLEERDDGKLYIRASQGHTIKQLDDKALLKPVLSAAQFPHVMHGTYYTAWEKILASGGLSKMTRNHIHFAPAMPGIDGVISGMRGSCQLLVFVDLASMLSDGIPVYESDNGVILTAGVGDTGMLPLKYITRVQDRKNGKVVWPASS